MHPDIEFSDKTRSNIDFSTLKQFVLLIYSTKNLSKKDKVRFFYALNGRNKKSGFLVKCEALHLGISAILVPLKHRVTFIDFLKNWNTNFEEREILME